MTDDTDREALADEFYADSALGPGYMERDDCEHLADRILTSGWLAADRAAVRKEAREQAFSEAVEAIARARNEHWRQRHVDMEGNSSQRDYATHDTYLAAANVLINLRDGGEQ